MNTDKTKRKVFVQDDLEFARRIFPGPEVLTGHNLVDPSNNLEQENLTLITFLREPLARCASHYQDQVLRRNIPQSFPEWIAMPSEQNRMVKMIAGEEDLNKAKRLLKEKYTFVGITEQFDASIRLLAVRYPHEITLDHYRLLVARDNHIKQEIFRDPVLHALLVENNRLDSALYRFAVEEVFEPAVEKHREAMKAVEVPDPKTGRPFTPKIQGSKIYNKFIYRQLLKYLKK